LKHGIFGNLQPSQFASLASLAKNHDPIAEANNLWQLRAYHDDRKTLTRKLANDPVDLDLRPNVDPARRLVEDEGGPRRSHPAAQKNLLLVPSGKVGDRCFRPCRRDRIVADLSARDILLDAPVEPNRRAHRVEDRRGDVGGKIKEHEEPLAFAVPSEKAEPRRDRAGGRRLSYGLSYKANGAAI
jgi:hypothetical protein